MIQRRHGNRRATIYSGRMVAKTRPKSDSVERDAGRAISPGRPKAASLARREALLLWVDAEGSITLAEARAVLCVKTNTMPSIELGNMVEEGVLVWSTMVGERTRVWCRPAGSIGHG